MLTGHRSVVRRRGRNSRAARIVVSLAIPAVALGVALGVIFATSGGPGTTKVGQAAFGNQNGGFSAFQRLHGFGNGGRRGGFGNGGMGSGQRGDLAGANATDAAGNAINLNQTPAQAAASMNCTLTVPANPLSAQGLATPWQLGDGCSMANAGTEGAFVEATILAPGGQLQVYNPLVITAGTTPAATPAPPTIAPGSQVIISVGFNGNAIVLQGQGAQQGRCVDALGNSVINQTPQCNAPAFYAAANAQIAQGTLTVPPAGAGNDGQPCETTRSFSLIDQDQSDNTLATYLFNPNTGQTAQDTAANAAAMAGDTAVSNGSDNGLLGGFVDPALGCKAFTAANTTNAAGATDSQALNELSARQNQQGTIALDPVNDPQLLVAGQFSITKTNLYRSLTDQPLLAGNTNANQNAATYCQNMVNLAPAKLKLDAGMEQGTSPVPALGNNLANFLAARLSASFTNLNCQNFGLANPVTLTLDGNGVAIGATFNTAQQTANPNGTATATATPTAAATTATAAATPTATAATPTAAATSTAAATTPAAAATTPAATATTPAAATPTAAATTLPTAAAGG